MMILDNPNDLNDIASETAQDDVLEKRLLGALEFQCANHFFVDDNGILVTLESARKVASTDERDGVEREIVLVDVDKEGLLGLFGCGRLAADAAGRVNILPAGNAGRDRRVSDRREPGKLRSSDGRLLLGSRHLRNFQDQRTLEVDADILVPHIGQLFHNNQGGGNKKDGRRKLEENEDLPQGNPLQHTLSRPPQGQSGPE